MTTHTARPTLQLQPSAPVHLAIAVAVALALGVVWRTAGQASHEAVQTATQTISAPASARAHITLPSVEVVGRREPTVKGTRSAG
jgi:hypothetical protein